VFDGEVAGKITVPQVLGRIGGWLKRDG
jgi:hypothetical protein